MFIDNTTPVGTHFITQAYLAGPSPVTLVGTNTNGIIIRTLQINNNTASDSIVIYADTAPPSATWDPTKRAIFAHQAADVFPASMPYPLTIPAGNLIYAAYTGAGTATVIMTYDFVGV